MSNNENHQANMLNSASIIENQFSALSIFINEAKKSVANVFTLKINNPAMLKNIEGFTVKINNISELLQENKKLITTIKESDLYKNIKVDPNLINPNFEDIKSTVNIIYMSIFAGTDYNRMLEVMVEEYINYYSADNEKRAVQYVEGYLSRLNRLEESLINLKNLIHEVTMTLNSYQYGYNDYIEKIYQQKFNKETSGIIEKYNIEVKNAKDNYEDIFSKFNILEENFKNTDKRNKELLKSLIDYEKRLNQIVEDQSKDIKLTLETKLEELDTIYGEKIQYINNSYDNAQINEAKFKDLVEKAGIYNLIVNYKEKAEEENKEYKKFRKYTNRAIYWAIGTAFVMFLISWGEIALSGKDTNLFFFIYRMSISLMFFVLAFYSSKQASKHYECFQDNNRTYLQLAALEPFMEKMSEDEKKEIRKNLVPIYFSQSSEGKYSSKGDEVTLPADLNGFAEKLIDVVKGLLDKAKDEPKP